MTTIRQTSDRATVTRLDLACFPDDEPYPTTNARWWLATDDNGSPVGFAGAKFWPPDAYVFLCRAGVLPHARGNGLQRRFIAARVRWARSVGARGVYTYTAPYNLASANNLIACGFRLFAPSQKWGGAEALYWTLDF